MSDHLAEALRLLDLADEPVVQADEEAALSAALVHAVLEVGEHVENLWDQVRRLADGVEQIADLAREHFDIPRTVEAAEPLPRCGSVMNPGEDGPVCVLEAGHSDYHADGHGNRWEP